MRQEALQLFYDYVTFRKLYGEPVTPKSYNFWEVNGERQCEIHEVVSEKKQAGC